MGSYWRANLAIPLSGQFLDRESRVSIGFRQAWLVKWDPILNRPEPEFMPNLKKLPGDNGIPYKKDAPIVIGNPFQFSETSFLAVFNRLRALDYSRPVLIRHGGYVARNRINLIKRLADHSIRVKIKKVPFDNGTKVGLQIPGP